MNKTIPVALSAALAATLLVACQNQANPNQPANTPTQPAGLQAIKAIPVGAAPHGMWAAEGFIYNSSTGAGKLVVIDTRTDTVVKEIPFPDGKPGYVKAFHDGKHVMVTDTAKGQLLVIDPAKDHQVLQTIALGAGPDKIAVDHDDNKTVFVTLTGEPKVIQLTFDADRSKPPVRKDFAVGTVAGEGTKHRAIAYDHGRLVTPNSGENNVSLIDVATGKIDTVSDGNNPGPVAIGTVLGAAKFALVGNAASNTLTIYDMIEGGKTTLSDAGLSPTDIAYDEESRLAYVTMAGSNEVAVVDFTGKRVAKKIPVGNRPVHIYAAPDLPPAQYGVLHGSGSHQFFVGNDSGDTVTVIDGNTVSAVATVAVGKGHHKMAFWGTKAYISNISDGTVSVIDRTPIK
ncbi:MAG: YncE family protein [Candidatus Sericytochromatia bacterium]